MKVNVQFYLYQGEKRSFAYGAVSVRGKPTVESVSVAVHRAFGSMGKTSLHSFGEGNALNKVGEISLLLGI